MQKTIKTLTDHYIICGLGRVGRAAANHFAEQGHAFVIIERDKDVCKKHIADSYLFLNGDATQEEILIEAGIKKAKGLLSLLNTDPLNLFTVLTARELNPTLQISARSVETSADSKIIRAGADIVISPYSTAGRHFAENILGATGRIQQTKSSGQSYTAYRWVVIKDSSSMVGKTIAAISKSMNQKVMGLRRDQIDIIIPEDDVILAVGDEILTIRDAQENNDWDETQTAPKKIIIIDDNPVIIRLYARLFQKAGFHPLTAVNGNDGLDLILKESPDIAVIDYKMPDLSGIEICRRVKEADPETKIKLILFTADERPEIKDLALKAGACHVITKSPEASEIIDFVKQLTTEPKLPS